MKITYAVKSVVVLSFLFFVSSVSVSAFSPNEAPARSLGGLVGLNNQPLETDKNCVETDIGFGGQKGGSLRAIKVVASGNPIEPIGEFSIDDQNTVDPKVVGQSLSSVTGGANNVAILVLDDFRNNELQTIFRWGNALKLAIAAQNKDAAQFALTKLATTSFSHGYLVFDHINAVIQGTGRYDPIQVRRGDNTVIWRDKNSTHLLIVKGVNIGDFETSEASAAITQAVNDLQTYLFRLKGASVNRFVFNMSFAIVPCTVVQDYQKRPPTRAPILDSGSVIVTGEIPIYPGQILTNFGDYSQAIHDKNSQEKIIDPKTTVDSVERILLDPVGDINSDPLHTLVQTTFGQYSLYMAAAGNFGYIVNKYNVQGQGGPLYPGRWQEVTAVSGSDSRDQNVPFHDIDIPMNVTSNSGEVMTTGAWYKLTNVAGLYGAFTDVPVAYFGTSFAAPVASVALALDLTRDTPACVSADITPVMATIFPFAPSALIDPPLLPTGFDAYCIY